MKEKQPSRRTERNLSIKPKYENTGDKPLLDALISPFAGEKYVVQRGKLQSAWEQPLFQKEPGVDPKTIRTFEIRGANTAEVGKAADSMIVRSYTETTKKPKKK